jgi:hypothetical protein
MGKNKLSESKNIHDQLNEISIKINNQNTKLEELFVGYTYKDGYFDKKDKLKKTVSLLQIKFQELFICLYNKCISDNYYWQYCPFKVYKETFNERLKQYTNFDFVDSNEIDFYNSELELISKSKNRYLYYFKVDINNTATLDLDFFSSENIRKIDYSQTRKIEFLKSKLKAPEVSLVANLKLNTGCSETELHEQITDTFRQKYKSLTEYIVSVDRDGKIVFLEYEDFCSKLNKLKPVKRYTNVVIWLHFLLEQKLITPSQIPDVLKIIKNETLITYEEIRDFIHDVDEVGKIVLLPRKEIWEKIDQLGDRYILIYHEFDRLITNNLLSEKYIKEHWNDVEQFKRFVNQRYDLISKQEYNKWENDIVKYTRSNAPIQKKINYLTELLTDIKRVDPDEDLALKPKIKLLKSLIKELKDKQKFETINPAEPSGTKNNTDNNQKDEISDTINKDDGKPPKIAIDALYKAFEDISQYNKVMGLLVSQNFIYPNSYKWKDKKSGYKNRICAFLKDIEGKNYFHEDIVLNYDLCKTIAKNTFNVDIKSNKTFYESILSPDLEDLIPFSTTID